MTAAAALAAAAATAMVLVRLLRGRVVDVPNERSSHDSPIPRGGGIAIIAGVGIGWAVADMPLTGQWGGVAFVAVSLGLVGLIDDLRSVKASHRLAAQGAVAVAALPWILTDFSGPWAALFALGAVIWIVGYTNSFNFMDGINGIAAAQLLVAAAAWFVLGGLEDLPRLRNLGVMTGAATLGFLPWNFPRARFFMGDVGSYFCGGLISVTSIVIVRSGVAPTAAIAPLILFGVDTFVTLVGRLMRGEPWLSAHRSHSYQRTVQAGWTHTRMALTYLAMSVAIASTGLLWTTDSVVMQIVGGIFITSIVLGYLALPHFVETSAATEQGFGQ